MDPSCPQPHSLPLRGCALAPPGSLALRFLWIPGLMEAHLHTLGGLSLRHSHRLLSLPLTLEGCGLQGRCEVGRKG